MTTTTQTPSTSKVRRDVTGGKRGNGNERTRRVRRADPRSIRNGQADRNLTGAAGIAAFGSYLRGAGVDSDLRRMFAHMKTGPRVVYPMETQLRLLMDLFVLGEHRVFSLEAAAADPLFVKLAGGVVPSLDTVYRDLGRFSAEELRILDDYVASHTIAEAKSKRFREAHLDIDTTVEPMFGEHEGALPGYNPRYHGRPAYHPIVGRLAELDMLLGAQLRPGDTSFGADDATYVETLLDRARTAVGPKCLLYVRIDAAGDCTALMSAVHARGAFFLTKARMTQDLCAAVTKATAWTTVDRDAHGRPTRQVAQVAFTRDEWAKRSDLNVRVLAVRSRERENGKQVYLWNDLDYTVQVFLTNDLHSDPDDLAHRYDQRAGIEPLIAELKNAWGIDKVPSRSFDANHAALLLKVLTHNLFRRYVRRHCKPIASWRTAWLRRAVILVPGRLVRSGRTLTLRTAPRPYLPKLE